MKKEVKLVNKVKRLLRKLRCPRYLHHYGPKKYEFYEHLCALIIRWYCGLSYRRIVYFLDLIGMRCPSKSALQYTARKVKSSLWNRILELTSGDKHYLVTLDATGISRINPIYYYLRRINSIIPKVYVKLSAAFDIRRKKFCSAKIRVKPLHDIKDAKYLLRTVKAGKLVADRAYDTNWLYNYCNEKSILPYIPLRKWGKPKHKNMSRRILSKKYLI